MFGFIGNVVKGAVNLVKNAFTIGAGVAVGAGIVHILRNRFGGGGEEQQTSYSPIVSTEASPQRDYSDEQVALLRAAIKNPITARYMIEVTRERRAKEKKEEWLKQQTAAKRKEDRFLSGLNEKSGKIMTFDHLTDVRTAGRNFFGICASDSINFFCEGQEMSLPTSLVKYAARAAFRQRNIIYLATGETYVADRGRPITLDFWSSSGTRQALALQDNLELIIGKDAPSSNVFVKELRAFVSQRERELIDKLGTEKIKEFLNLCEECLDLSPAEARKEKVKTAFFLPAPIPQAAAASDGPSVADCDREEDERRKERIHELEKEVKRLDEASRKIREMAERRRKEEEIDKAREKSLFEELCPPLELETEAVTIDKDVAKEILCPNGNVIGQTAALVPLLPDGSFESHGADTEYPAKSKENDRLSELLYGQEGRTKLSDARKMLAAGAPADLVARYLRGRINPGKTQAFSRTNPPPRKRKTGFWQNFLGEIKTSLRGLGD